jgi:hypothetical protein
MIWRIGLCPKLTKLFFGLWFLPFFPIALAGARMKNKSAWSRSSQGDRLNWNYRLRVATELSAEIGQDLVSRVLEMRRESDAAD